MKYLIVSLFSLILTNCATQQQAPESAERSYSSEDSAAESARQVRVWDAKTAEGEIADMPEYDPEDTSVELLDIDPLGVAGLVHKASAKAKKCDVLHVTVLKTSNPQTLSATCDGSPIFGPVLTSTGPGKRTPMGTFTVFDKIYMAYSAAYNNAPMARFLVFHNCGTPGRRCIGIHATVKKKYPQLGTPASKGCIRLTMANAEAMWALAGESNTVKVTVK